MNDTENEKTELPTFGAMLKAARISRDWTRGQAGLQFARYRGWEVDESILYRWETCRALPETIAFLALCDMYALDLADARDAAYRQRGRSARITPAPA